MPNVVVIGGGACGLATALLLAKDGHEVTVLERDTAIPPLTVDGAWTEWERRGVNQFRMLHLFASRWRQIIEAELPEVAKALDDCGALRYNAIVDAPVELTGGVRSDDDRFDILTGRRPVVEAAMARVVEANAGVTVRRGVAVAGLRADASGDTTPHVIGVRTEDGEDIDADLVVDMSGRRSALSKWLDAIGARAPQEEVEDSGFVYYGRYFRSADGSLPYAMGGPLQHYDSVSTLTLPADNGTWGVGVTTSAKDAELRKLSDVDAWMRAITSFPLVAHWVDAEPLDDAPAVMAKIEDRHRRFVVDGEPVATGVVAVADSWACTNPSLGRGVSIGLMHAQALRDLLRTSDLADRRGFALAFDERTQETVEPWFRSTLEFDRHRLAEIDAQIAGRPYRPEGPEWPTTKALELGANQDGDLLRALLLVATVQQLPGEVLAAPGIMEKVLEKGQGWEDAVAPGPSRAELVAIVRG